MVVGQKGKETLGSLWPNMSKQILSHFTKVTKKLPNLSEYHLAENRQKDGTEAGQQFSLFKFL